MMLNAAVLSCEMCWPTLIVEPNGHGYGLRGEGVSISLPD